jgi:hypothetical protein
VFYSAHLQDYTRCRSEPPEDQWDTSSEAHTYTSYPEEGLSAVEKDEVSEPSEKSYSAFDEG